MQRPNDQWYLDQIRAGGQAREQATDTFMQMHMHLVRKLRSKFKLDQSQALDIYTDAVVDLLLQVERDAFRGSSALSTYFYRMYYNKCVDLLRKRTTNLIELNDEYTPLASETKPDIQKWFDVLEVQDLKKAMKKLGEPCYQILMDWGFWGYNMQELAARVGYDSADQVKKRKYKCLQQLRKRNHVMEELWLEQFDAYYQSKLADVEKETFERRLHDDPGFAQAYDQYLMQRAAIAMEARDQLRARATELHVTHNKFRQIKLRRYLSAAAIGLLVIAASVWMLQPNAQPDAPALFAEYYDPPVPSTPRDGGSGQLDWYNALEHYRDGTYAEAAVMMRALLADENFDYQSRAQLYIGICALEAGDYQQAIDDLEAVSSNSQFYSEAQWYLALTFLRAEKKDEAMLRLRQIRDTGRFKSKEANEILAKLR